MAIAELPIASTGEIRVPAAMAAAAPTVQVYFGALALLSLGAFVFGVENRFISDGLIRLPPLVDWVPPRSAQEWLEAFAIHQRDPAFAACGGTESLGLFKVLYWWEWLRRESCRACSKRGDRILLRVLVSEIAFRVASPRHLGASRFRLLDRA